MAKTAIFHVAERGSIPLRSTIWEYSSTVERAAVNRMISVRFTVLPPLPSQEERVAALNRYVKETIKGDGDYRHVAFEIGMGS